MLDTRYWMLDTMYGCLMLRFAIILSSLCPFLSRGQQPVSPETIWKKCVEFYKQGKLDSFKTNIVVHKDYFQSIDTVKQFYVYWDTLRYDDGYFGIGNVVLDPLIEYNNRQIGMWTYYYPNGILFARGKYSIGAYTECQAAGPGIIGYSFKSGNWSYWYDNKQLMTEGVYLPVKEAKQTNCGTDWVTVPKVNNDWKFYLPNGDMTDCNEGIRKRMDSVE